jgi:hypothetical protein
MQSKNVAPISHKARCQVGRGRFVGAAHQALTGLLRPRAGGKSYPKSGAALPIAHERPELVERFLD